MEQPSKYEYLSEEAAKRNAEIYGLWFGKQSVAVVSAGKKGWFVVICPGHRLCPACNGTAWVDEDRACEKCVRGWITA